MKYSDEKIREYIDKINKLLPKAYIPYSKFPVAAVIVDQDDNEHYGVNVENASYGLAICAERNAIASSILKGMKKIKLIVITATTDEPISPCGMCRQVIREFATKDTMIVLASNKTDKYLTYTVDQIIPYSFGPEHLV